MSDAIANFFYRKVSIRVSKKWDLIKGQVTQESVVKNRKLFSHVLTCTLESDNPYLLTPTSMNGIRQSLKFKDDAELMFGDRQEIEEYAEELFGLFFDEYVVQPNDMFSEDTYQLFYCDYLPYAKNYISLALLSDENIQTNDYEFREALLGTTRHDLIKQQLPLITKARHFLYQNNKEWFLEEIYSFIAKTASYKFLPNRIDSFAHDIFIKKIKDHLPTSKTSLGIRTKEIFESDLAITDQEIRIFNWQNDEEEYKYRLFKASLKYINDLEKIFMKQHK